MPVLQGSLPAETPTVPWRALFFSRCVKEARLHHLQSILLSPFPAHWRAEPKRRTDVGPQQFYNFSFWFSILHTDRHTDTQTLPYFVSPCTVGKHT